MDKNEKIIVVVAVVAMILILLSLRHSTPDVNTSMTPYERQQISNMQRAD